MYLMNCTRPNIAYDVSKLSTYTSNPGSNRWKAIIQVLRYLRHIQNYGLHHTKYPAVLEGYSNTNWISDTKDSKSTSGYVFTLGVLQSLGNLLSRHAQQGRQWNLSLSHQIKQEKKQNGFVISQKTFQCDLNLCQLYAYTVIVKQQQDRHRIICITVSLDIFVVDIIPLGICSPME